MLQRSELAPQEGHTYTVQAVQRVFVVEALLGRLSEVALHADHEDFYDSTSDNCSRGRDLRRDQAHLQGSRLSPRYRRL